MRLLLISIITMVLLLGCTTKNNELVEAQRVCSNNDGLKKVTCKSVGITATCNNGAKFEIFGANLPIVEKRGTK